MERIGCTGTRSCFNLSHPGSEDSSTGYNPIIELAKETDTPLHLWKENTLMVDDKGHLVATPEANRTLSRVWKILEAAIEYSSRHGGEIDPYTSLYDFFEDWCEKASKCGDMAEEERKLVLDMSQMWGAYVGDPVQRQSLKYFFLEDCIAGGRRQELRCVAATNSNRRLLHPNQLPKDPDADLCDTSCTSAPSVQYCNGIRGS